MDALTGQVVFTQAKQRRFQIAKSSIQSWQLDNELSLETHAEWLDSARQLHVLDTANGRLAILICEDLGRTMSVGTLAAQLGVSLVISPVFSATIIGDPSTNKPVWSHDAAQTLITEIGSRVAVCNSNAVARAYLETSTTATHRTIVAHDDHRRTRHR